MPEQTSSDSDCGHDSRAVEVAFFDSRSMLRELRRAWSMCYHCISPFAHELSLSRRWLGSPGEPVRTDRIPHDILSSGRVPHEPGFVGLCNRRLARCFHPTMAIAGSQSLRAASVPNKSSDVLGQITRSFTPHLARAP